MTLIVTDKQAVDAAFEAARPRPIREVMLETYPDAVEDANGRFHAPHDGYVCPITEKEFRAGEWHEWTGTRAQRQAVWPPLIAQTRAHEALHSEHVGTVGQMANLRRLALQFVRGFEGFYGTTWLHVLKDPEGNVVVYKGSKRLRSGPNPHLDRDLRKGDLVSLRCKVKEHGEREGVKQTVVQRPKVIKE